MNLYMPKLSKRISAVMGAAFLAAAGGAAAAGNSDAAVNQATFHMVRSSAAVGANCLNGADATVTIQSQGPVEVMKVSADHLPRNTDFDFFVIQVPNPKFGISWYQGDLEEQCRSRRRHVHRALQHRDLCRGAGYGAGSPGIQEPALPGCCPEPGLQSRADVPPGPVVQLAEGRSRSWLPGRNHAVQR